MIEPTIQTKTRYCDSVPCTIHDHSGWIDRVKDYNFNQPTIKEKIEKLLTDEVFNSEPCNIRLFATNVARLICEEMIGKMIILAETFGDQDYNIRVAENEVKLIEAGGYKYLERETTPNRLVK